MIKVLLVGLGGGLGALARYGLSGLVQGQAQGVFPWGTLVVNLSGCFVIGVIMTLALDRQFFSDQTRVFLTVGVLGGYTTFSSFGYETLELMRDRCFGLALGNAAASVLLGLTAVWLGRVAVEALGL